MSRQSQRRSATGTRLTLRRRFIRVAVGMEEGVLVMVIVQSFVDVFVYYGAAFLPFFYRFRIPKRDKKGHELAEI